MDTFPPDPTCTHKSKTGFVNTCTLPKGTRCLMPLPCGAYDAHNKNSPQTPDAKGA